MKQSQTTMPLDGTWSLKRQVLGCVLVACVAVALLGACGGESTGDAGPAADSPYARAESVTLVCGLGAAKPGKGWLIRRSGDAADGEMAMTGEGPFRESYRYAAKSSAVDGLFDAMWQARFLEVPAGSAGDYG